MILRCKSVYEACQEEGSLETPWRKKDDICPKIQRRYLVFFVIVVVVIAHQKCDEDQIHRDQIHRFFSVVQDISTLPTPMMKTLARMRHTVSATSALWNDMTRSPLGIRRICRTSPKL